MPEPALCVCPNPPMHAATCPATADLWPGVAPGGSTPDPLAPFRALADQYAAKAAESTRNANTAPLTIRTANQGIAAGWRSAEFLLRHTLNNLDNHRTTPDNPPASDDVAHSYLSTGCHHGEHAYCQGKTGQAGPKKPATCKFCDAPCVCPCHQEACP